MQNLKMPLRELKPLFYLYIEMGNVSLVKKSQAFEHLTKKILHSFLLKASLVAQ